MHFPRNIAAKLGIGIYLLSDFQSSPQFPILILQCPEIIIYHRKKINVNSNYQYYGSIMGTLVGHNT